jgi:glucosamine--fructose-6-phosphate aminotransferase (isomerizing)
VANAHPHQVGGVSVVHNGIIENHAEVRAILAQNGTEFSSQTDTELIAHLVARGVEDGQSVLECMSQLSDDLEGAWAVVVLWEGEPDRLYFARRNSPLVFAHNPTGGVIASDISALHEEVDQAVFLEDGDYGFLDEAGAEIYDHNHCLVVREPAPFQKREEAWTLDGHDHFMHKEIHEQPNTLRALLQRTWPEDTVAPVLEGLRGEPFSHVKEVVFLACGTSAHAGMVGEYLVESLARVPARTILASEFRYRVPVIRPGTLVVGISQSGETADTLAAMQLAAEEGALLMGLCNVQDSAMERLCREHAGTFLLQVGAEIGVASTKAFTAQVLALMLFARQLAWARDLLGETRLTQEKMLLQLLPGLVQGILDTEDQFKAVAEGLAQWPNAIFLGRNIFYPVALEAALKLKEISYIHAEGFAAGEMKHGPLALVEPGLPVLAVVPSGPGREKTLSNLEEAKARGARIVLLGDPSDLALRDLGEVLALPDGAPLLEPILASVAFQLVAYHGALSVGADVDKPRNLAKSVTVE